MCRRYSYDKSYVFLTINKWISGSTAVGTQLALRSTPASSAGRCCFVFAYVLYIMQTKCTNRTARSYKRLGLRMECDSAWQLDRKLLILSIPNSIPWRLSSHEKVSPFWSIWMPLRMNSLSHTSPLNSGRQSHVHESGSRVPPFWHIRMQAVRIQRMNFELITIKCYDHMWIQHRHTWKLSV